MEIVERGAGVLAERSRVKRPHSEDPGATLADLREAVSTLEDTERIARRVLGGAHPDTESIEYELQDAQAALNAQLRAAFKEDPSSLSADDRARAEQLLARDARKAAKKAARGVSSETPSPGTAGHEEDLRDAQAALRARDTE